MHGGVTGKASDGLPMSIQPRVGAQRLPWERYRDAFSTLKEFANLPTLSALLIPDNAVIPG
jgi:hypothetical protein